MAQSAACQTAAATVGLQGAREEEEEAWCSMAALLKRRMDAGEFLEILAKSLSRKYKVKSLHSSTLAFFQFMLLLKFSVLNVETMSSKAINKVLQTFKIITFKQILKTTV